MELKFFPKMIHPIENISVAIRFQSVIGQGGSGIERETVVKDQVSISREAQLRFSIERQNANGTPGETELSEEEQIESSPPVKPGVEFSYTNASEAIDPVNSDVSVSIFA